MSLVITKETGGYFSFVVDGNIAEKVTNMRNDVLVRDGYFCDFKTANGANIIKIQRISVTDITLIASGTFTFLDVETFLAKLIDVGFYDWLLSVGGGIGENRFDELLDTFNYFGKNGQAVRVNETEQKLETFTVYNYRKLTDLEDTFSSIVANKMLATNASGTAIELKNLPKDPEQYLNAVGSFHYADSSEPITVTTGVETKLTNDTLGFYTNISNAPFGISSVWNPVTNQFDFSQLTVGDLVKLRPDLNIDLVGTNTSYKLYMKMAIGSTSPWTLTLLNSERKATDEFNDAHLMGFDIGNTETKDFPAEIYILTDAGATVNVNGWYVEIIRKNINVIDINVDSTPTDNSINPVSSGGVFDALALKSNDIDVLHKTGGETKTGNLAIIGNLSANNLSGTNTGDETTLSIQTKRHLKTIVNQSLEGSGNIDLTKNDVGLSNVDNTSDLSKPISIAMQTALNLKANIALTVRKISTNTTLAESDNGTVILLTSSCTVTLPNGLSLGWNCSFVTATGVTMTYALGGSIVLINNSATTMAEKLSHTITNTGVLNEYLTVGL